MNKISPDKIKIDGIITEEEIKESKILNIDNEISPGYNIPSAYKTLGYVHTQTNFFMLVIGHIEIR